MGTTSVTSCLLPWMAEAFQIGSLSSGENNAYKNRYKIGIQDLSRVVVLYEIYEKSHRRVS